MMIRKHICIVNFLTHYDWRMARQLPYLIQDYDVTVVCFKEAYEPIDGVRWKFIDAKSTPLSKIRDRALFLLGKLFPSIYDKWYWWRQRYRDGFEAALETKADAYQADDWASLPAAVEAARRNHAVAVYDAYEYWSLEAENQRMWKLFASPLIKHLEDRFIPHVSALISVSPPIVERYKREYSVKTLLIMNAPQPVPLPPFKPTDPQHIRLINHGSAVRDRHIERMIEVMPYLDDRYTLDFIFLPLELDYIEELKALAHRIAPGRVTFLPPLDKSKVLLNVALYDIGIFIIPPVSYNYHNALPNRFFDFISSGLAVCVGPSPAMSEIVQKYQLGVVAPSFEPAEIGEALNRLTAADIDDMKQMARVASVDFDANTEIQKYLALYSDLLRDNA